MRALAITMLVGCGFQPAAVTVSGDGAVDAVACRSTCQDMATLEDCATNMPVTCPLGCHTGVDTDRCSLPVPSNGAGSSDVDGVTADLLVSADALFDTDTGAITTTAGATLRTGGFGLAPEGTRLTDLGDRVVLGIHGMHIAPAVTLRVAGTRSVIVLATRDVLIEGIFDASAGIAPCAVSPRLARCGGAGGGNGGSGGGSPTAGDGCSGGGLGFVGSGDETGGGGGGYGGAKAGDGGTGNNAGGVGGAGGCSTQQIVPLVGGSGGGGGGNGGSGGGGGGAIQISALGTIRVVTPTSQPVAGIKANGAGGEHGGNTSHDGGGGGGSAGAILLEAQSVTIDGAHLVANAGGGGAGDGGGDGQPGSFDSTPAPGGTGGRAGGAGASRLGTPQTGTGGGDGTGGGGGGFGRIYINCGVGYYMKLASVDISPAEFTGAPPAM